VRTELSIHPGAQPHCPDVSASLGPTQCERDGKGAGQTPAPQASLWQLLPQFPHSQGSLEGGFGRGWLVLRCVLEEEVTLYFHISQATGRLAEGPKASSSIQGTALVLLTSHTTVS